MNSIKERYISNTPLKDRPRYPAKLSLKDNCVTTKKLADRSVTLDKLSNDVIRILEAGAGSIDNGKGMIIMCSVFSEDSISENANIGDIGTFVYQKGTLVYKKGQKESGDNVVGDYEKRNLSKDDVYLDMQTGLSYRWNGNQMVDLLSPLTTEDIDRIIVGEKTPLPLNSPINTEESENPQVDRKPATKMVVEEISSRQKYK